MRNQIFTALTFLAISAMPACKDSSADGDKSGGGEASHSHEGSHGGELVELGSAAHIEFVRNEETGEATLYITGSDGKTPFPIAGTPELKLATDSGQKAIKTTASNSADGKASEFTAKDDALKSHEVSGRISITVDGKLHNPEIAEDHGHDHK
jgi:hypothetical protein